MLCETLSFSKNISYLFNRNNVLLDQMSARIYRDNVMASPTSPGCSRFWWSLSRKKTLDENIMKTPLKRCLSTTHLIFFGIGQMAGAGVYVLTGPVMKDRAGPATFISYILAGIVAMLAALCYAEFGARVPKAGSSYSYAYITVGEIIAFIIGWNILLEHTIGAASIGRAWSGALDGMLHGSIRNFTITHIGRFNSPGLAEYPDFIGPTLIIIISIIVGAGAKMTMNLNSLLAAVNLVVTVVVAGAGFAYADVSNWTFDKTEGGFMPFGFSGVLGGAAMCFYAYVGFDSISIAGEETENPARAIPISNGVSVFVVTIMYVLMSLALSLLVPWRQIDPSAAFTIAFTDRGVYWAEIVVSIGALVAMTGTALGTVFSVPRCAYAMASDGLIFKFLAYVHPKTQTPVISVAIFSLFAAFLACLLDLEILAEFVSLGTLVAVVAVAACVIILRYQTVEQCQFKLHHVTKEDGDNMSNSLVEAKSKRFGRLKQRFKDVPILRDLPDGSGVPILTTVMLTFITTDSLVMVCARDALSNAAWWAILLVIVFSLGIVVSFLGILTFEQNDTFLTFQMPLVPFLPAVSMFLNVILLLMLSPMAWARFGVWMAIGFAIYFFYGIRNSTENEESIPLAQKESRAVDYATNEEKTSLSDEDYSKAGNNSGILPGTS